jgi:hypothetical protein
VNDQIQIIDETAPSTQPEKSSRSLKRRNTLVTKKQKPTIVFGKIFPAKQEESDNSSEGTSSQGHRSKKRSMFQTKDFHRSNSTDSEHSQIERKNTLKPKASRISQITQSVI